ncbi:MAG TPA: serine--tRNA ligase [Solirubrobacteraceae bacterium]|jgi:seryl-tRNA synthetase|nr:serine--tRNA ligase [Solirubrobacteraceae bacterium]
MLDLKLIREDPERVRAALARRGGGFTEMVQEILSKDQERRAMITSAESLRAMQKTRSDAFAAARARGEDDPQLRASMQEMSAQVKVLADQAAAAEQQVQYLVSRLPNLPDPLAAAGPEDEVVKVVGEPRVSGDGVRDHLELAGPMIDMDHAARLSGTRFAYLKGDLVMVELALVRFALEKLRGHGFEPVIPPVLVRERALYGTGFLPDTEQQIYRLADDDLYLAGTSEVALASLHDEEILPAERLPLRYAGFSSCFRREAGAAGKDTRGIFRVHQFEKVEMFSFVEPQTSTEEHQRILAIEEEILAELQLPYRVVNIAVNDLGNSAAKKYDCEAWLPSQGRYRELTSCSNTTDYQARRLNIRLRRDRRVQTLHTLNGTAVAVGRTIIALLENGQREDGTVALPGILSTYGAPAVLGA